MREIKFRAWDGKKMDYDCRNSLSVWNGILVPEGDHIPMQFTGLKDCNGREIYEGDIISSFPGSGSADAGRDRLIVEWAEECPGFYFKRPGYTMTMFIFRDEYLKTMLVIGNIYENPELIK